MMCGHVLLLAALWTAGTALAQGAPEAGAAGQAASQGLFNQVFGARAKAGAARAVATPLLIDGAERGLVNMTRSSDDVLIDRKGLFAILREWLDPEAWARLEAVPGSGTMALAELRKAGLGGRYDPVRIVVEIDVPLASRPLRSIDLAGRRIAVAAPPVQPASFSAYVNARLSSVELMTQGALFANRTQQLAFDGAARAFDVVFESENRFTADNSTRRWRRGDSRFVHDDVATKVRFSAGDIAPLSYGFINTPALIGFAAERRFELDPLNSYRPAPTQRVRIESPTSVDVVVNNRIVRTLRLDPGMYSLENLPVVTGANDVALRINEPGGRVRTETLRFFFDPQLLKSGVTQFSTALGAPLAITLDGRRYAGAQAQAWLRHGWSDTLTAGGGLQADTRSRLLTTEATTTGSFGTAGAQWGASSGAAGSGQSARVLYRWQGSGDGSPYRSFQAQAQWNTPQFSVPGAFAGTVARDFSARWAAALSENTQATLSARRREAFQTGGSSGASVGIRTRLDRESTIDFSWDHSVGDAQTPRNAFFVTFRWVPESGNVTVAAQFESPDSRRILDAGFVHAADAQRFSGGARLVESSSTREQSARVRWEHARIEADARAADDVVNRIASRTREWSVASALAFADGSVGVMRPIRDSFALVEPHPRLAAGRVLVDPLGETAVAQSDWLGAPVLSQVSAYVPRQLILDAEGAPPGFDFGDDRPVIVPTYRSGTVVPFGLGVGVAVAGILRRQDGSPLAFASGELLALDAGSGQAATPFFTNRQGRFRSESMRSGDYRLHVQGSDVPVATVRIGADEEGTRDLGIIHVLIRSGQ